MLAAVVLGSEVERLDQVGGTLSLSRTVGLHALLLEEGAAARSCRDQLLASRQLEAGRVQGRTLVNTL